MYYLSLFIHSWLRWGVLILALIVIFRSLNGWLNRKAYTPGDNLSAVLFISFMHLQLVIGLLLYFVYSPFGQQAFANNGVGAVMKDGNLRFWAVEHITTMILAVVLAQVGRSRSKKAVEAIKKHKNLAIFTIIALVLVLIRVPWDQTARMFRGL